MPYLFKLAIIGSTLSMRAASEQLDAQEVENPLQFCLSVST